MSKHLKNLLAVFGLEINRIKTILEFPIELSKQEQELVNHIFEMKYSMTSVNNLLATALACKSIIKNDIAGDFVECGTYRGGHALLAAAIFNLNNSPRKVWLYDTFEGMTQPQEVDVEFKTGVEALQYYTLNKVSASNIWCYASLNEVRDNFKRMQLLSDDIKFIKGDVCLTLKESENLPTKIAMLRLDTDWYQSTKIELQVLFPLLAHSGILVVDDYGWWKGSKIATDEYFKNTPVFMSYVDQGARLIVKNNL